MTSDWLVICLCAEWCGVCREWRDIFAQAAGADPDIRFAWVDVEDEAEAMGDVDIETFPTVLVAQDGKARFYGPVLPSAGHLTRLLASLAEGSSAVPAEAQALLTRLAPLALSNP